MKRPPTDSQESEDDVAPVEEDIRLDVYAPKTYALISVAFGVALTVFCAWATWVGLATESSLELVVGRIGFGTLAAFSGAVSVRWLRRLGDSRPLLSVDRKGILDRTALGRPLHIPWEQVISVQAPTGNSLELEVRDFKALHVPWFRRLTTWMLRGNRTTQLVIPIRGLRLPAANIVEAIAGIEERRVLEEMRSARRIERAD